MDLDRDGDAEILTGGYDGATNRQMLILLNLERQLHGSRVPLRGKPHVLDLYAFGGNAAAVVFLHTVEIPPGIPIPGRLGLVPPGMITLPMLNIGANGKASLSLSRTPRRSREFRSTRRVCCCTRSTRRTGAS
ncbi:MAG: hypothetical protein ACE5F1_03410, partial [Planctomycetota bacterium]